MSDRYEERHFIDGFNAVQEGRQGLSSQKARTHDVALTEKQCRDLASQPKLTVADWTDLTGVGRGMFGMYQVSAECVEFRRWSDHEIRQYPSADQVDMERENASPALSFPCSPDELVTFVDKACIGGRHFELPESFRSAVAQLHGSPLNVVERRTDDLPAIEPPESLRVSVLSPSGETGDVLLHAADERARQSSEMVVVAKVHATPAGVEMEQAHHQAESAEAPRSTPTTLDVGVSKNEILAVFIKPIRGQTEKQWANMLADARAKWLRSARVCSGGRGVQSQWNPARLAMCLAEKGHMQRKALGNIIRRDFPEYLSEWEAYADSFD